MAVDRFVSPVLSPNGDVGEALPNAKLYFYVNGSSTTLQDTYTDVLLTTAATNPVVADGNGRFAQIFGNSTYSVRLDDENDNVIWGPFDDISISAASSFTIIDAINSAVTDVLTVTHETTDTPTAGIGTGIALKTETSAGNNETGARIASISTDVTSTSEDFDLVTYLMAAGATAAEVQRITSAGVYTTTGSIQLNKGADVASAAALPVLTDGNYFDVTGTTAITSINTTKIGNVIRLHFDGILTLTHHATDLILPSAANITTAAGDVATFVEYATGDYQCTAYTKADGTAVATAAITAGSVVFISAASASSDATIEFTGLDSTYDQYKVVFINVFPQTSGQSFFMRMSTDAGSTWLTDYSEHHMISQGTGQTSATTLTATEIGLNFGVSNAAGTGISGEYNIYTPSTAGLISMDGSGNFGSSASLPSTFQITGRTDTSQDVDALEFRFGSGNITSGLFALYGVKRA